MINPFESALTLLQDFGFFSVILPLILVFVIFYAILEKTKIFDAVENHQAINTIIAFVAAFFVIVSTPVVEAIQQIIPSASLLLIISMLLLMLLAFFGLKTEEQFSGEATWAGKIGAVLLILIFLGMIDLATGIQIPIIHQMTMAMVGQGAQAGIGVGTGISQETINMIISFALIFGIPIIVLLLVVWKSKKD